MVWKNINIANPGTSSKFGSDDFDLVADLFNGVTSGLQPVIIKSTAKFGFGDNVLFVQNVAGTFQYNIRGSAITGNRDLTLPLISSNDLLLSRTSTDNPVQNKTLDATCSVAAAVGAGTPANVNTVGQGFYKQKVGSNFEFRGINAASTKLSMVLNTVTNTVDVDIVEANLNKDNMAGGTSVVVLDREMSTLNVENTTTETTIFTHSIPGNTLGTNKLLRLTISGDYLGNSATARFITIRVKYGATTIYADATNTIVIDASRRAVLLTVLVGAANATNSQVLGGYINVSDPGGTTSGTGDVADDEIFAHTSIQGFASEDSTLAKDLTVTIQHSAAETNVSFRRQIAILELL